MASKIAEGYLFNKRNLCVKMEVLKKQKDTAMRLMRERYRNEAEIQKFFKKHPHHTFS
jgi:hypothetical protein